MINNVIQRMTAERLEALTLTHEVKYFLLPVSGIEGFIAVPLGKLLDTEEASQIFESFGKLLLPLPVGDNNYVAIDTELSSGWQIAYSGLKHHQLRSFDEKDITAIFSTILNFRESSGRPPKSSAYAQSVNAG
ncbi:MAG: hypothetical protein V1765_01045 [bacterium]